MTREERLLIEGERFLREGLAELERAARKGGSTRRGRDAIIAARECFESVRRAERRGTAP